MNQNNLSFYAFPPSFKTPFHSYSFPLPFLPLRFYQTFTMTTTPLLSVHLPRPRQPEIVYSNFLTMDRYYPPHAPHVVWWLENANIFLSIRGIIYGLRQIHFIQSPILRRLLTITKPPFDTPFGTTPSLPIPFDNIQPSAFREIIYLLHLCEIFKTTKESWLQIFQIAKDWEMPHAA